MANFFVDTGTPARENNFVLPLVNGEEAWRYVYNHIRNASRSVHLCFWHMESGLELVRNMSDAYAPPSQRRQYTLAAVLNARRRAGVKVRILLWDYPLGLRTLAI